MLQSSAGNQRKVEVISVDWLVLGALVGQANGKPTCSMNTPMAQPGE